MFCLFFIPLPTHYTSPISAKEHFGLSYETPPPHLHHPPVKELTRPTILLLSKISSSDPQHCLLLLYIIDCIGVIRTK